MIRKAAARRTDFSSTTSVPGGCGSFTGCTCGIAHAVTVLVAFAVTCLDAATAKHPTTGKRFVDMTYQPMLEVLAYLRANGFKNFIVSGGGIEFMRVFAEEVYGVPPEQVIGSSIKTKYEMRDGNPAIVRLPELDFIDDLGPKKQALHAEWDNARDREKASRSRSSHPSSLAASRAARYERNSVERAKAS